MKRFLLSTLVAAATLLPALARHYAGGDISLLPEYENVGAEYLDRSGNNVGDLLDYSHREGLNLMRVRLFVNPEKYTGTDRDPNACQDFDYILPLCKRIQATGHALMLDFHYSDFWADPQKQWTPADWASLSDEELYQKIYDYTRRVLEDLKAEGVVPEFIQTGNEISYGMLWGKAGTSSPKKVMMGTEANWPRFIKLLQQAGKACREVCPDAKIIIHTERVKSDAETLNFYNHLKDLDYDVIGLSYYPYWHGALSRLESILKLLTSNYPQKEIQIVETGYPYKWEVPGSDYDYTATYPYSDQGQASLTRDLVKLCRRYGQVTAIVWWWMEYNAYGTNLQGWYNAPLFDSTTGRVSSAMAELAKFGDTSGIEEIGADNASPENDAPCWYDLQGRRYRERPASPGLYIHKGKKVIVR